MDIKEVDVTSSSEHVDLVPYHYFALIRYKDMEGWFSLASYPLTNKEALLQMIYNTPNVTQARIVKTRLPR